MSTTTYVVTVLAAATRSCSHVAFPLLYAGPVAGSLVVGLDAA